MAEQQLLLVDKNDRFLRKYAPKWKCHTGQGLHHRALTVLIYNKKGEVLLQKRRHRLWDDFWDLTNSHPIRQRGGRSETYQQAAKRCLKREWGIKVSVKKIFGFNYFAKFNPLAGRAGNFCENEYCAFLIGEYNGRVFPNPELAYGYRWLPFKKLLREIKNSSEKYTPWAIKAIRQFSSRAKEAGKPLKMEIVLGKYAGFCPGVKRAWGLAEEAISKKTKPIYILGELIHNRQALDWLTQKGIKTIKGIAEFKDKSGTVIIRAHGEPPEIYRQLAKFKNLTIVDATCPSVSRVQKLAAKLEGEGFKVIVCGEKDHPEAIATVGCTQKGKIISSIEEARKIPKTKKIGVVSQTTFSPALFKKICSFLKKKAQKFKSLGTICNFTQQAQKEARQIARQVGLVIVVGGRQSSNTKRLAEVAGKIVATHHIETAEELKKAWFVGVKTVGLLAGASTPDWIIKEVLAKLND